MFKLTLNRGGAQYLPDASKMPYLDQNPTKNGCGTTCLAMAMTYLGAKRTREQIDRAIRRCGITTSPQDLIKYATKSGLLAKGYNKGTWEDVKAHIDLGHPCICYVYPDYAYPYPYSGTLGNAYHYLAICGYGVDPTNGESYAIFHDPKRGIVLNNVNPDFEASMVNFNEIWNSVGWGPWKLHNYYIAVGSRFSEWPGGVLDDLRNARDDDAEGTLGVMEGAANVSNGICRLIFPKSFGDWIHGVFQLVGGIVQVVVCGIGAGIQALGLALQDLVDGVPVLQNIGGFVGNIVSGVGAAVSDIGNGVGNAVDDLGNALDDLLSGDVGGALGDTGQAVGDTVGGVIDAVGDVFSGW